MGIKVNENFKNDNEIHFRKKDQNNLNNSRKSLNLRE